MNQGIEFEPAEELQREAIDLDALARRAGWIALGGVTLLSATVFAAGMAVGIWIGGGR